ncbi:hypothetical protein TcasGA2_TC010196 [Tribolium castaneum]|uniref:ZP domain-containing protein n=1 Tax=Tribolium castaneum TaxID=7070 RepID=D6WTK5_TRICA|nr:PREDICTED: uncharacterized protein LOC663881 [Tribolium castaneum]EFA07190.1 hypothetical protein TcasGA2_TC010196 [Tribolium castaneum]|eukprot:XP_008196431.1 PREDICTED: uncharacterized protein LOC663881 [Tribolium castaneum]
MMTPLRLCAIYCLFSISSTSSAFPPSLRYPIPISVNKITAANLTCDVRSFNATVTLQHPFKGLVFAKDFSHECNALGTLSNSVTINLPTAGCGIRLSSRANEKGEKELVYSVVLVAQQDRHLRQIADQEKHLECVVKDDAFLIESQPVVDVLKNDLLERRGKSQRSGRMKKDQDLEDEIRETFSVARVWMEITPEGDEANGGTLKVGEAAVLTIKSTLPEGIGWKVVECSAHDGLGDSSQKLLDDYGCPTDELLFPVFRMGPVQVISVMKHQEAVSRFAAFKFPDRDRLHLSCYLELCRGTCPEVDCSDKNSTDGEVLDRLKVFNSVEVLAPAIDDLRKSERLQLSEPTTSPFSSLPGDRKFCVSPDKVAITFCILGVIFLCAVVVAACALLRSRKNGDESPFYPRSLFSSSTSGSAYGSKLLLHESPCMGQSPSRRMPYGRIL